MDTIRFKPTPKQFYAWQALEDPDVTEIGYGGAASGGKTYLGCVWLVINVYAYAGSRWFMGRRELKNLRKTTLATFYKVCQEFGILPGRDFKFNATTSSIQFANGSEILLLDLSWKPSDPLWTALGGLELTGGFVDQSEEILESAIQILHTRVGRWKNNEFNIPGRILESFNPAKNHVYHRFYKPDKDGTIAKHKRFIRALPTDNPYTSPAYILTLKRSPTAIRERLLYGNFEYEDDPNALFDIDALNDMFSSQMVPSEDDPYYITCDSARKGKDRMIIALWKGWTVVGGKIRTKCKTTDTEDDIKAFCAKYNIPMSRVIVDEGGEGGGVIDHLGCKGFIAASKPIQGKAEKKWRPKNYRNLRAQVNFHLSDIVAERKIAIKGPLAQFREQVIEELEQIKGLNLDTADKLQIVSKDDIKEAIGRSPDFADTLAMRAWFDLKPEQAVRVFRKTGVFAR